MVKDKLDIYTFGKQLIETMDLDPVYVILHSVQWNHKQLCDWLLAYWCFYHCGTASWIANASKLPDMYWERFRTAASSKDYPRASERRHFRGKAAIEAVEFLINTKMSPTQLIGLIAWGQTIHMIRNPQPTLSEVMDRVKELRNFGNWIAFKVADMLERLEISSIQFQPSDVFYMFEAPRKGAEAMAEWYKVTYTEPYVYEWAYNQLHKKLGKLLAPPRHERRINIQEIETILCKWKSHLNGHYTVGKDTKEVKHGLELFQSSSTLACELLSAGKAKGLW
jgi:hypothetical protein